MRALFSLLLIPVGIIMYFAFMQLANAAGPVVDPGQTPTWTITCVYPVEREDNTPLALNEIARVDFHVSQDQATWVPAGSNASACRQVYDLSLISDGQYYYTATAIDTEGRESDKSPEIVAVLVKRIAKPWYPTGLSGSAS